MQLAWTAAVTEIQLVWKIIATIAVAYLVLRLVRYAKLVRLSVKRLRTAEKQIKSKQAEIQTMALEKAESLGKQVLNEMARAEPWVNGVPANVSLILEKLHPSVQSLFRTHRKFYFPETGTKFNTDFLLKERVIQNGYQIGLDPSIQHKLISRPGSPLIVELNERGVIVEEYQSIYHYFLLAEREI